MSEALVDFMVQDGDAGAAGQGFDQVAALTVNEANHRCHAAETLRGSALRRIRLTRVDPSLCYAVWSWRPRLPGGAMTTTLWLQFFSQFSHQKN